MAITGIMVTALYAGINSGFYSVRLARENLRATEILVDKMEAVRVCTWSQINSNGFILPTFTALYCPDTANGASGSASPSADAAGVIYTGAISVTGVTSAQLNAAYNDDVRQVTINLKWNSGSQDHSRQVTHLFLSLWIAKLPF